MQPKYLHAIRLIISLLWIGLTASTVGMADDYHSETESPLFHSFEPEDHGGRGISTQIGNDTFGNLFFTNEAGLLRYDGTQWTRLPPTGHAEYLLGTCVDHNNNVWVAGSNSVGYYTTTTNGKYSFVDLTNEVNALPNSDSFGEFWRIFCFSNNNVYLITSFQVLKWDGSQWHTIASFNTPRRILTSQVNDTLYIHSRGEGFFRINADQCEKYADEAPALSSGVISIQYASANHLIYATIRNGIFHDKDGKITPFTTEIDPLLKQDMLFNALLLPDQSIAVATNSHGLYILNQHGQITSHIQHENSWVYSLYLDQNQDLWATEAKRILHIPNLGISRYRINDPVDDLIRHNNNLYIACRVGLKMLPPQEKSGERATIQSITENDTPFKTLALEGDLIFGGNTQLGILHQNNSMELLPHPRQIGGLQASKKDPSRLYIADNPMISRVEKRDNRWQLRDTTPTPLGICLSMLELSDGTLLATFESSAIKLISWPSDQDQAIRIESWTDQHGLPDIFNWAYALDLDGGCLLITDRGLFRMDPTTQQFHYDPILGNNLGSDAFGLEYCSLANDSGWVLWLPTPGMASDRGRIGALRSQNGTLEWEEWHLPALDQLGKVESILHEYQDEQEILWIGGIEELFRYALDRLPTVSPPLAQITSVIETTTGHTLFGGAGAPAPINTWDYPLQTLDFTYGAKLNPLNIIGYQTRLLGFDTGWTAPSHRTNREFTKLFEGKYTFQVRAIDEFKRAGPIIEYHFTILPPWYRSWPAYLAYALICLLTIILIARWWTLRLRRRNLVLEKIVNQRTSELERRNLDLIEANNVKQDFLASMSHEIRNPLNGILGIAQLLRDSQENFASNDKRIRHLHSSASHLHQLLGQVLDYSSLEAGKLEPRAHPFDPIEMIQDVINMHRNLAEQKNLEFTQLIPKLHRLWIGDDTLLRQIIINLISNAIKYTSSGWVRLSFTAEENEQQVSACFVIEDSGPGIPKDKHSYIFENFTRLNKPGEGQVSGTGLGLAIASQLAKKMGGALTLDPNTEIGARFILTMRFPLGHMRPAKVITNNAPHTQLLLGKHVLIADDLDINRFIGKALLEQMGASVDEAEDGKHALELLQNDHYDLAVLDINMPKLSGIEVISQYLAQKPTLPPRLIALSAYVTAEMEAICLARGFHHFIEKPLNPARLTQILSLTKEPAAQTKAPGEQSLLSYLANNDPKAAAALKERYRSACLKELKLLRNGIESGSTTAVRAALHKLTGLSNIRRDPQISKHLETLSQEVQSQPMLELLQHCDHIEAILKEL